MELSSLSVNQSQISTDFASVLSDVATKIAPKSKSAKVLEGAGVSIRLTTDFEKLLAELDLERKDKKQDAIQSQFSLALAALTAAYEGLSSRQAAALEAVSETSDDVTAANAAVADAQGALDASSEVLAALTKELEELVEEGVTTTDDRVEELTAKIEEQKKVVAADMQALAEAKTEKAEAEAAFATALSALGSIGVSIVIEAGISTAKMLRAAAAERANPVGVQKANAIIDALGDLAEKLAEMQEEELREEVAKITPILLAFATVDTLIDPGEFPEYEHRI